MHPGYVLMSNGQCCDDKIYLDLGMTAEFSAWWREEWSRVVDGVS
jgi:hypothetical protein